MLLTNDYLGQNSEASPDIKRNSRKRRHKRIPLGDTNIGANHQQVNPGDSSITHENMSTNHVNKSKKGADKRLVKMSYTTDDTETIELTRRRRKVRSSRKSAPSSGKEVLELEVRNNDANSVNSKTENRESNVDHCVRKPRGHGHQEKRRRSTNSYKYDSYQDDSEFDLKYCLDLEDILQPADLNHSSTRFIGGHTMPQLRSQQTNVVYIEKKGRQGFVSEDRSKIIKVPDKSTHVIDAVPKGALHFILNFHLVFRRFALMIHGLLAGLALSQLIFVYSLSKNKDEVLLESYHELAVPYHCMYYFLLAICNVSIFDRYINIGSGWCQFFSILIRKPSRGFALIFYVFALVLSTGLAQLDYRISLYKSMPQLWKNNLSEHIAVWKIINLLRVVGSVLGWVMICLAPNLDETLTSIEDKLKKEQSDKVSTSNDGTSNQQNSTTVMTWDGTKS